MNMYTKEIADLLKVSLEDAVEIQGYLEYNDFDFSEASKKKLKREAEYARHVLCI